MLLNYVNFVRNLNTKANNIITLRPGKNNPDLKSSLEELAQKKERTLNWYCVKILIAHVEKIKLKK